MVGAPNLKLIYTIKFETFKYRIQGTTQNSKEFSKAFNCKIGQSNDPINKCNMWQTIKYLFNKKILTFNLYIEIF